jgi:acetylornithine deacetylase/succinyl-diaminopimelate desuccinylase-like protein
MNAEPAAGSPAAYLDRDALLADLDPWLRIPSISADPEHAPDVRASAEWLAARLRQAGFPEVTLWETAGHPTVCAHWPAADPQAPVVVVYGHHDVQPVDPLELWQSPPFEPTVRGDELLGRGTADDKGQVLMHLHGLAAHLASGSRIAPAVTLKFVIEGEEESGSAHFAALLREHADELRCDVVVVSDTSVFNRETPSLCTGMRGGINGQVDLYGPEGDLHSGSFGGAVPNPLHALADLISGLHDADGRVTIDGFYDRVRELDERERALFAKLPFDEAAWLHGPARSKAASGEAGFTTLERIWARPTVEINGMWGGYNGPGSKTIIPSSAHAKVSFRIVVDQEPEEVQEAFRAHVRAHVPAGIEATVSFDGAGVRPCLTPLDAPELQAAARAMGRAFGQEVLFTREGGSGPEADLAEILAAPVIFFGVGLPDDRIHAPNERVVIPMLLRGAEALAYLWDELAALPRGSAVMSESR